MGDLRERATGDSWLQHASGGAETDKAQPCVALQYGELLAQHLDCGLIMWRWVIATYALICLVAIALLLAGTFGWFGVERDPLSGTFAIMLALPWSAILGDFGGGPAFGLIIVVAGMFINLGIIAGLRLILRRAWQQNSSTADAKE